MSEQLQLTREDIEGVTRLLAGWLSSQQSSRQQVIQEQIHVEVYDITIFDILDLDAIVSSIAGLQDPLGQLRTFIANVLNTIASRIIAAVQVALRAVGRTVTDLLNRILNAIYKIPAAIEALKRTLERYVLDPLLKALDWVARQLPNLVKMVDDFIATVGKAASEIPNMIVGAVEKAAKFAVDTLHMIVDSVRKGLEDLINKVSSILGRITSSLKGLLNTIVKRLSELGRAIYEAISAIPAKVAEIVSAMGKAIQDAIGAAIKTLSQLPDVIKGIISEAAKTVQNVIAAIVEGLKKIPDMIATILDTIRKGVESLAAKISEALQVIPKIVSGVVDSVVAAVDKIVGAITGIGKTISDFVAKVVDAIKGIPKLITDTLSRIINVIQSAIRGIADTITRTAKIIVDAISAVPKIVSDAIDKIRAAVESAIKFVGDVIGRLTSIVQKAVNTISAILADIGKRISETASKMVSTIVDTLSKIGATISKTLSDIVNSISRATKTIASFLSHVADAISKLPGMIQDAIAKVINTIRNAIAQVPKLVRAIIDTISNIPKILGHVFDTIRQGLSQIWEMIKKLPEAIISVATKTIENVQAWIWEHLPDWVKKFLEEAPKALTLIGKTFTGFINAILKFPEWFPKWFYDNIAKPIVEAMKKLGEYIWGLVPNWLKQAFEKIRDFFAEAWEGLVSFFKDPVGALQKAFEKIGEWFWGVVPDWLKSAFNTLKSFLEDLKNALQDFLKNPTEWIKTHVVDPLGEKLGELARLIWKHMPDKVKEFFTSFASFLSKVMDGLITFFRDPVGTIRKALEKIGEWIWGATPQWFKDVLETVKNTIHEIPNVIRNVGKAVENLSKFANNVGKALQNVADTFSKLGGYLRDPVKLLQDIWGAFKGAAKTLWDIVVAVGGVIVGGLAAATKTIIEGVVGVIKAVKDAVEEIAKGVSGLVEWAYKSFIKKPLEALEDGVSKAVLDAFKSRMGGESKTGEVSIIFASLANLAGVLIPVLAVPYALEALSEVLEGLELRLTLFGSGATYRVKVLGFFKKLVEAFKKLGHDVTQGLFIGMAFNMLDPYKYVVRPISKVYFDTLFKSTYGIEAFFELPSEGTIKEIIRRRLASGEEEEELFDKLSKIFMVRGLPAEFYKYITRPSKDWFLKIKDRWGIVRMWPLSPIYEYPTVSELARFMIKDMFGEPSDFIKAMQARGVPRDIALFFYLNHFRYPSVEKLAHFFWRGVAGELWNPDKSIDAAAASVFGLEGIERWVKAPRELNFKVSELYHMITTYLKWQDYARFPWKKGFPTDNAIVMDLIADVPGKIDLRWMTKWGIFDVWGMFGKTVESSIEEITLDLIGGERLGRPYDFAEKLKKSVIEMDIRQFCRTLQAVGLHPYWVPWVGIAETINALTEERTLLRTGFINLFKEGFWDKDTLDQLLGGFFTIKFRVAYLDMSKGLERAEWVEKDVYYPVAYLPAEARLLELRAAMDRALDILRDFTKTLNRAYYENVVATHDEYAKLLGSAVEKINEWFVPMVKSLTGKELAVTVDEKYWQAYAKVLDIYRSIYTYHRIRYWVGRILGWLIYRLAYGYVKPEDVKEMVDIMAKHARMVEEEKQTLTDIMVKITGIARREYIPTPAQLAAIAEVVPEAKKLADTVFEARGVPEDWRPIWRRYIEIKPVVDELRRLVTALITYYAKGVLTRSEFESYLDMLKKYGWTDFEIQVIKWIAEIRAKYELMKEEAREYIPTPAQLAAIAEVVPEAKKLAEDVFLARHVPDEWRPIWEKYIKLKPISDEVRKLLSTAISYYARGVLTDNDLESVFNFATKYGWTDEELGILREIANIRKKYVELKEEMRQYIPTPLTLASMAEVVPEVAKYAKQVFEARRVPDEWRPIWEKYIDTKPIVDDVRRLLMAYRRAKVYGVELGDLEKEILDLARKAGWTDRELNLLALRIHVEELIEEARELRRQYLPTPAMLATLSEYLVLPADLVKKTLEARRVPEEWLNIWLRYIEVKPIKGDAKQLLSVMFRALRYGVVEPKQLEKFIEELVRYGFTPKEIELLKQRAELEEAIVEARELRRQYLPTPYMLATLSEYVQVPAELVKQVLEARRVSKEWIDLWIRFIQVRPLADEARLLATAYFRAKRYGVPLDGLEKTVLDILKKLGFTNEELKIRELRASIEAMIDEWRETQRQYIPTPAQLATIAEIVPEARQLLKQVLEKRRVPKEWVPIWAKYVAIKPVIDEVKGLLSSVRRLYEYFAIKPEEFKKWLERLKAWGYEDSEIQLMLARSEAERALRAWRELLGSPRALTTLAEYSPTARRTALSMVYRMIDALPVDGQTKEFLKKMWEEYVKVRPVYDEVRRYVTELVSDYASGTISRSELEAELKELKKWGLDDYEIQFYLWLAERRRQRYLARRLGRR